MASTWLADNLRPAGGVSEGGTGIGALGSVEDLDDEYEDDDVALLVVVAPLVAAARSTGCGALGRRGGRGGGAGADAPRQGNSQARRPGPVAAGALANDRQRERLGRGAQGA